MVMTIYYDDGYEGENDGKYTEWAASAKTYP